MRCSDRHDTARRAPVAARDAHADLRHGRRRAPHRARCCPDALARVWGGATFDVALRFLSEDPWERLALLRERSPQHLPADAPARRNLLGYDRFPEPAVRAFVAEAVATGIDIFRIFDALNNIEPMLAAIDAARESRRLDRGRALLHRRSARPGRAGLHARLLPDARRSGWSTPASTCSRSRTWPACCARPPRVTLVEALRSRFDAPVHLHTHDTAGGSLATYLAAVERRRRRGRRRRRAARRRDQPAVALGDHRGVRRHRARARGRLSTQRSRLEPYWEAVRALYAPFEAGLRGADGPRLPPPDPRRPALEPPPAGRRRRRRRPLRGDRGRLRARQRAARQHHQGHPDEQGRRRSRALRRLGRHRLRRARARPVERFDLPDSVLDFLRGGLGEPARRPAAAVHRAARSRAARRRRRQRRSSADAAAGLDEPPVPSAGALAEIMFPGPHSDYAGARSRHGDVSLLPTAAFFYGLREDAGAARRPRARRARDLRARGDRRARRQRRCAR